MYPTQRKTPTICWTSLFVHLLSCKKWKKTHFTFLHISPLTLNWAESRTNEPVLEVTICLCRHRLYLYFLQTIVDLLCIHILQSDICSFSVPKSRNVNTYFCRISFPLFSLFFSFYYIWSDVDQEFFLLRTFSKIRFG